jgi:hypothetical protein
LLEIGRKQFKYGVRLLPFPKIETFKSMLNGIVKIQYYIKIYGQSIDIVQEKMFWKFGYNGLGLFGSTKYNITTDDGNDTMY